MERCYKLSNVNTVEVISVIHVSSVVGEGTEEDPIRSIDEYFDTDGDLLARKDRWCSDGLYRSVATPKYPFPAEVLDPILFWLELMKIDLSHEADPAYLLDHCRSMIKEIEVAVEVMGLEAERRGKP